jgi:hypothetical protein
MINWQQVILNLRSACGSIEAIHRQTGLDWKHLENLSLGNVAEPRFNSGMKLLDLHERKCRKQHTLEHIGLVEIPTP